MKKPNWLLATFTFIMMIPLLCWIISCQPPPTTMVVDEGEEEIKAMIERSMGIWNEGNLDLIDELYDPENIRHDCSVPEDIIDLDTFKNLVTKGRTAFPDQQITIDELIVEGNTAAVRWTMTGTNTGPLDEKPPTGKSIQISGATIAHVEDGKFVEEWIFYNDLDAHKQLGFTITLPEAEIKLPKPIH